jgi:hypothetical protein
MVVECFQMPANVYGDEHKVFSLDLLMVWVRAKDFLKSTVFASRGRHS